MKLTRTTIALVVATALSAPIGGAVADETSANYTGPALGTDMWTGYMARTALFVPHYDNCDTATEAFVAVSPDGKGYCIEINERAAIHWDEARHTCLQLNKRLPEPGEFKFACTRRTQLGLQNMTNNKEWASNFALPMARETFSSIGASSMGLNDCVTADWSFIGATGSFSSHDRAYRCVH